MTKDFLSEFLEDPARARVLRLLVLNDEDVFTLTQVSKHARITERAAEKELKFLEALSIAKKARAEKTVPTQAVARKAKKSQEYVWMASPEFRYRRALDMFIREVTPVENANVLTALRGAGKLSVVILSGSFMGDPSRPADLLIAGDSLNERRLDRAMRVLEPDIGREIRYAAFSTPEFRYRLTVQDRLIRDTLDYPHRVLLDRGLL